MRLRELLQAQDPLTHQRFELAHRRRRLPLELTV